MGFHIDGTVTGKLTVKQTYDCCGKDDCDLECTEPCIPVEPEPEPCEEPASPDDQCVVNGESCILSVVTDNEWFNMPSWRYPCSDEECCYIWGSDAYMSDIDDGEVCSTLEVPSEGFEIVENWSDLSVTSAFFEKYDGEIIEIRGCIAHLPNGDHIPGHTHREGVCYYTTQCDDGDCEIEKCDVEEEDCCMGVSYIDAPTGDEPPPCVEEPSDADLCIVNGEPCVLSVVEVEGRTYSPSWRLPCSDNECCYMWDYNKVGLSDVDDGDTCATMPLDTPDFTIVENWGELSSSTDFYEYCSDHKLKIWGCIAVLANGDRVPGHTHEEGICWYTTDCTGDDCEIEKCDIESSDCDDILYIDAPCQEEEQSGIPFKVDGEPIIATEIKVYGRTRQPSWRYPCEETGCCYTYDDEAYSSDYDDQCRILEDYTVENDWADRGSLSRYKIKENYSWHTIWGCIAVIDDYNVVPGWTDTEGECYYTLDCTDECNVETCHHGEEGCQVVYINTNDFNTW